MTGPDLRAALRDLGEDVRTPDLVPRALATSRHIRRRRIALATTGTVVVLTAAVVTTALVRPPSPTVAPPATGTTTPAPSTTEPTIVPPTSVMTVPPVPPTTSLNGTLYYLDGPALYARTGDGRPRLVRADLPDPSVTLSPDGRRLAWIAGGELMVSDVDGGDERLVALAQDVHGLCNHPAWAPDSRRVAFQPDGGFESPWATVDVDTGDRVELGISGVCYPTWSPDGTLIGWYDGNGVSGAVLTTDRGADRRDIPHVDGVDRPCRGNVLAVWPGGRRALVSDSPTEICGDGPGRSSPYGVVVDTATGRSLRLPVEGRPTTGIALLDGSLIAHIAGEFVLLNPALEVVDRAPAPGDDEIVLLAYTR